MNSKEQEDVVRTAAIIRTARKLRGKTQSDIAVGLGVSQSYLSKLEHGYLIPSSSQWFSFCRMTEINPMKTFDSGFIDHGLSVGLESPYPKAIFKLNPKYTSYPASKVRALRLAIQYFITQLGKERFLKFCDDKEVDPDFFLVLDNQINLRFELDLVTTLLKQGVLIHEDLSQLLYPVIEPSMHGTLHEEYDLKKTSSDLIECFVQNQEKYETHFNYQIESKLEGSLVLSVTPCPVLEHFDYKNAVLKDFLCRYNQEYLRRFASYGGHSKPAIVEERQCHFKGHEKCVYEIRSADSL